jgi:gamma-glutamylcyclotransferase (GGCT)/AIG2-like uncharacterized protein YtfP
MRRRVPSAKPLLSAVLPDYRLVFESNEPAGRPPAFFANVRPAVGSSVPGAVYFVDEKDLFVLDKYEDVFHGVYVRSELTIHQADGKRSRALVYVMPTADRPLRGGRPSLEQLTQIKLGYADWALDQRVLDRALHGR